MRKIGKPRLSQVSSLPNEVACHRFLLPSAHKKKQIGGREFALAICQASLGVHIPWFLFERSRERQHWLDRNPPTRLRVTLPAAKHLPWMHCTVDEVSLGLIFPSHTLRAGFNWTTAQYICLFLNCVVPFVKLQVQVDQAYPYPLSTYYLMMMNVDQSLCNEGLFIA